VRVNDDVVEWSAFDGAPKLDAIDHRFGSPNARRR
jgi:hypothetical protein